MTYTGAMVLPSNAVRMNTNEMRYVDGGISIKLLIGAAALYVVGTAMKATRRYVGRVNGIDMWADWNPSKKSIKIGNLLVYVSGWLVGYKSKTYTIGYGIYGAFKAYSGN